MNKLPILVAAVLTIASAMPSTAVAQAFPSKPIRVITPNSAGGTSDIFVRALSEEMQKRLGQPIVIDNRSGGGMNIAGRACAEAPNDGHNICILPNEVLTLNEFTFKSIPYNPAKDFEPITNCFINTQVLVVSSALNVNSLAELAALSKAKPGTLSYSALAIPMQITFENWKKKTGADIVSVPSRGGGDMVTGLLTGTTPVAIVGLPNFIPYIRSGAVKALAGQFRGAVAVVSRRAHAQRAWLPQSRAGLLWICRARRNAGQHHQKAARRDRRDRHRAVLPAEAFDRDRYRAGIRYAGAFWRILEGSARERPEADTRTPGISHAEKSTRAQTRRSNAASAEQRHRL